MTNEPHFQEVRKLHCH